MVGRAGQYKIRDGCQPRIWVLVGELSDWNKGNLPRNKHVRYRIDPVVVLLAITSYSLYPEMFVVCLLLAKVKVVVKDVLPPGDSRCRGTMLALEMSSDNLFLMTQIQ